MTENLNQLEAYFRDRSPMAVAVSGGVDSMTLAVVAHRANPETQIFHAISPAVPEMATRRVKAYAESEGWQLNIINAGEMDDAEYLANPANRCYFCKTNLYDKVTENTRLTVASGTNLDDLGDYRPGLIAAEEHQVCHPYVEVGISKQNLRDIAATLNLDDLKDLPAAPCLSSRVTTGIRIDEDLLPIIDTVERGVWDRLLPFLTLQGVRCRVREGAIAIQIETHDEFDPADDLFSDSIDFTRQCFTEQGYARQVTEITIEPYEKGSAFLVEAVQID